MNPQLKIRLTSSLYSLYTIIGIGIAGFLISPDFIKWTGDTFKEYPFIVSFFAYMMPQITSAIRNYFTTKKLGAINDELKDETFLI